jgi:phosphoribosylanthranilate isomerase
MIIKVAIKREQSQAYLSSAEREQAQRESSFLVKVCGMRDAENICEVEALGIDLMGFIFWPKSSRYVSERPAYLPTNCKRVGVFVDEDIETVKRIADDYALDYIQLHGHELAEYCAQLKGLKLIKAFNIATTEDFKQTEPYTGIVDYFLFDTKGKSVGGNGEKFDWSVLSAYDGNTPFLLSGGIGPDDAEVLTSHFSPLTSKKCVGIDLNSRFEIAPGLKDINKLKDFLNALNNEQD